jgi:hypothetical protein
MSSNDVKFEIDYPSAIAYLLLIDCSSFIAFWIMSRGKFWLVISLVVWITIAFIFFFIADTPLELTFDNDQGKLTVRVLSGFRIRKFVYDISQISYGYVEEVGGRGTKSTVFKINDLSGTPLVSFGAVYKGWRKETIKRIYEQLDLLKQK